MPIHCFLFEILIIQHGFTGLRSYRVFRESGPWIKISNVYSRLLFVLYSQRWSAKRFCDTWTRQGPYYHSFNRLSLDGGMPQSFNRGRRKNFRPVCANHNAETEKYKKKSELKRMSNSKLCCCEIRLKRKKIRKLFVRDQQQKGRKRKPKSKNVTDDSSTTSWILCDAVIGSNLVARNSRSEYLSFWLAHFDSELFHWSLRTRVNLLKWSRFWAQIYIAIWRIIPVVVSRPITME